MNLDPVDFIILLGIAQGFFLAIALPISHTSNKMANNVLSLVLIMACIMLTARMVLFKAKEDWVFQWGNLADLLIFLFGPLAYLYFRRLFFGTKSKLSLGFVHFIPAGLFLLFLIYIFQSDSEEYVSRLLSGDFRYPFMIVEGLAIIFNLFYWYQINKLFLEYRGKEKELLSFSQGTVHFTKIILLLMLPLMLVWLVSFLGQYVFHKSFPVLNYEAIWVCIPIVIYCIGFYALRQPEIFRIPKDASKKIKTRNRLSPTEIESLNEQLKALIEQEQLFLDNSLTLKALSERLETSPNNLSWFLNNTYHMNFYEYVNTLRIAAFLNKIQQKEHLKKTLFALSLEVGFNSKSTFNKAFKSIVKETPSNYIKKLQG